MKHADLLSLSVIDRIISFDTTSVRSNLPLIEFVREYLTERGADCHLTYDATGEKANLLATIGPRDRPGVVLSGHTDTVPVTGQKWTVEPHAATVRNDRVYGRGTCDMKGFLAISIAFADVFRERGIQIPIHYALSYDEEVGALGVPYLIEDMLSRRPPALACIVGEPSNMHVINSHKGKLVCRAEFNGVEAHTGVAHIGANAIEAAGKTITFISEMSRKFREEGPWDDLFEDPKYTTVQVCLVEGGTAVNIVPNFAAFDFDVRYLPSQNVHDILRDIEEFMVRHAAAPMRKISADTGVKIHIHPGGALALDTEMEHPVIRLAQELSGTEGAEKVGFGTEAGYFQKAGIPTVICGPGYIDQAHKPDEFVEIDQIARCERFLHGLTDRLVAGRLW